MNLPNALQVNSRAAKVGKAFNYLGAKKGVTDLSRCYGCCNKVLGSRDCCAQTRFYRCYTLIKMDSNTIFNLEDFRPF